MKTTDKIHDIIIIGGGIIGCSVMKILAGYSADVLLLEAGSDVSLGASRANSGIVHAGYDCKPNTLKAKFNVLGSKMMPSLVEELHVPYQNCGSLVVADCNGMEDLKVLKEQGDLNGVYTEIIDRAKIEEIEPNISDNIEYALYAPTAAIVSPYKLTIAMADYAVLNGGQIELNSTVTALNFADGIHTVISSSGEYKARLVINCAGTHSMEINKLAGAEVYPASFRRGEYFVLDSTERSKINTVIFGLPGKLGKGILVAPSADGNVLYGPTSIKTEDSNDNRVTLAGLKSIREGLPLNYKSFNYRKVIRVFAGLRSVSGDDFIIRKSEMINNYIMALGICSPGLSASPAIGKYVADMAVEELKLIKKDELKSLPKHKKFTEMTEQEIAELALTNSKWGRMVCRCEKVTEQEIINAINSPLKATTIDAVKRRTRAGMGRCQGGFCGPRVMEILASELNIPINEVTFAGQGSEIAISDIKSGVYDYEV